MEGEEIVSVAMLIASLRAKAKALHDDISSALERWKRTKGKSGAPDPSQLVELATWFEAKCDALGLDATRAGVGAILRAPSVLEHQPLPQRGGTAGGARGDSPQDGGDARGDGPRVVRPLQAAHRESHQRASTRRGDENRRRRRGGGGGGDDHGDSVRVRRRRG